MIWGIFHTLIFYRGLTLHDLCVGMSLMGQRKGGSHKYLFTFSRLLLFFYYVPQRQWPISPFSVTPKYHPVAHYFILTPSGILLLFKAIDHKKKGKDLPRIFAPTKIASALVGTPKNSLQSYSPSLNISPFWFFLQQNYMMHTEI